MDEAMAREKQTKCGSRANKPALISDMNSGWIDLYETLNA
jgi:predicted GIY-YIG superfamily endonuclease